MSGVRPPDCAMGSRAGEDAPETLATTLPLQVASLDGCVATLSRSTRQAVTQRSAEILGPTARPTSMGMRSWLICRAWFDPRFLWRSCERMEKSGVVLATYANLQESSGLENPRRELRAGSGQPPWRLHPVFQERHARFLHDGRMAVSLGIHERFVQWLRRPQ